MFSSDWLTNQEPPVAPEFYANASQTPVDTQLRNMFVHKRLSIVPYITACIVAETVWMFAYGVLVLMCWYDWGSQQQHVNAWLLLLFYVFFWTKTTYSFVFKTFGGIVSDTKLNADNPVEESYNLGWLAVSLIFASIYTSWLNMNEALHIRAFSV